MSKTYFEEYLPKDLIEYLRKFTGPIEIWYIKTLQRANVWGGQQYIERRYGYLGKSEEEMDKISKRYGQNSTIHKCQIIFVDGKAHRLYPLERLNGMPSSVVKKRKKQTSWQCTGKTKQGKRCKTKTRDTSKLCTTHRE